MVTEQRSMFRGREVTLKINPEKADSTTYELVGRLFANLDALLPIKIDPSLWFSRWARIEVDENGIYFFENHYNRQVGWANVLNIYPTEKKVEVVAPHIDLTYGLVGARTAYKQSLKEIFPNFKIEDSRKG